MTSADFINNAEVQSTVKAVLPILKRKHFSDIVDADGHQYVDLVMEGGGVLGIALVGYTYMLEQAGIRFLRVGGTSAGSINALLLAGLDTPEQPKAERILEALAGLDMFSLVDGNVLAKGLIRGFLKKESPLFLVPRTLFVLPHLFKFLGLNPGETFLNWLQGTLQKYGIQTTAELRQRMRALPRGLRLRKGKPLSVTDADCYLALVAADITTETKVDFPRMASLYLEKPLDENPARFVRASMSIPFFFTPLRIENVPRTPEAIRNWSKLAGYDGAIPTTAVFVDGGIMSNFPIDLFHDHVVAPTAPTFGAKLGPLHRISHHIGSVSNLGGAAFDAARHCLDYDFISRHPDYNLLVTHIDTTGHNWINFFMSDSEKIDLFVRGVVAAAGFLKGFDWEGYKHVRKQLAGGYRRQKKST